MSSAARSLHWFGLYLCVLGAGLLAAPHLLLAPFAIVPADVWVRVCGLLAALIGLYYLLAARHDFMPILQASVVTRLGVLPAFALLVAMADAPRALLLFGLVDAAAALWTAMALRRTTHPPQRA